MQNTNNSAFPLMISIVVMNASELRSVYALLGGAAIAVAQSAPVNVDQGDENVKPVTAPIASIEQPEEVAPEAPVAVAEVSGDVEVDAHGHPWSPELHASTMSKTKDGLWRMKVGVERPSPKPGFPIASAADTGTAQETSTPSAISQPVTEPASAPSTTEEEDEFAAFRNAAAASDAADVAAKASVPPRTYSDADLGALCNQAAVKLGDPSPIKEIITQYVPSGEVAHSRNIPEDKRAEFVKAVEAKAGIEFAG